jgi:hypothetical protein
MCVDINMNNLREQTESLSLNELYGALAKAQGEIEFALADSKNPFFKSKYAKLEAFMKVSREPLSKNGLAIIQRVLSNTNDKMYLYTRLCHVSGQWIESKMPISPVKNDVQSIGSYITYLRRYNWACVVGISSTEDDDDGEAAMPRVQRKEEIAKVVAFEDKEKRPLVEPIENGFISPAQIREIDKLLFDLPDAELEATLKYAKATDLSEVPQDKYQGIINALTAKINKLKEKK